MISPAERRRIGRILSAAHDPASDGSVAAPYYRHAAALPPIVALTGPPGAGKSTLLDRVATFWAERGGKVALLAIDPSSPFSGGAVLGDRIRANAATSHPAVYMRSMSAPAAPDDLVMAVMDSCAILGGMGFGRIVLEMAGAGQMNVEALNLADCVAGISVPGLGDAVQLSKAGILEIADVHVVNKDDLGGAHRLRVELDAMLDVAYPAPGHGRDGLARRSPGVQALLARHGDPEQERSWRPPVLATDAVARAGIAELCGAVDDFLSWQVETGRLARRRQARMVNYLALRLRQRLVRRWGGGADAALEDAAREILAGRLDLGDALDDLLAGRAARPAETTDARS